MSGQRPPPLHVLTPHMQHTMHQNTLYANNDNRLKGLDFVRRRTKGVLRGVECLFIYLLNHIRLNIYLKDVILSRTQCHYKLFWFLEAIRRKQENQILFINQIILSVDIKKYLSKKI